MNKKTLEQRLRSIDHYTKEVKDLEETLSVTKSTLEDIVSSLKEFCPLPEGSVIIKGDKIRKVINCDHVDRSHSTKSLYYNMKVQQPSGSGWGNSAETLVVHFSEVDSWKIYTDPV